MLDFNVEYSNGHRAELSAVTAPGTTLRAPVDRRAANSFPSSTKRRRRRHDGVAAGKPAPLAW
jgi:hypothetical protein